MTIPYRKLFPNGLVRLTALQNSLLKISVLSQLGLLYLVKNHTEHNESREGHEYIISAGQYTLGINDMPNAPSPLLTMTNRS